MLYGNNVATYKPVLADCLITFAQENRTHVTLHELAQAFFVRYRDRLRATGLPQQSNPARKTVLERTVEAYQAGELSERAAVDQVAQQLGETISGRRAFLERTYAEAQRVLIHV